jgi:outer membrane protein assembly factor BamE
MIKLLVILTAFFTVNLLTACSTLQFPGVYKITVEQGNVITQEMIDKLKPGMTTEQVEFVMGTPLIKDTFNPQRWDYLYSISKRGAEPEQHRISIFFKNEKLDYFSGDFVPAEINQQTQTEPSPSEDAS